MLSFQKFYLPKEHRLFSLLQTTPDRTHGQLIGFV